MRLAAPLLVLALLAAIPAEAAEIRVAITKQRAPRRAYPKALMRGIRDALRDGDVAVLPHRRVARTMRKLRVPRKRRSSPTAWAARRDASAPPTSSTSPSTDVGAGGSRRHA